MLFKIIIIFAVLTTAFAAATSKSELKGNSRVLNVTDVADTITPKVAVQSRKEFVLQYFARANWFNANLACLSCNMVLASINTEEEQRQIELLIAQYGLQNETFWTSGTDLAFEGRFNWFTNGNYFTYTNWTPGQPDNDNNNEHCVEMAGQQTWNDAICLAVRFYICEREEFVCI